MSEEPQRSLGKKTPSQRTFVEEDNTSNQTRQIEMEAIKRKQIIEGSNRLRFYMVGDKCQKIKTN